MIVSFLYHIFVFFLIVMTLPLQIVISILIVISSGLPILFKQIRIGKKNKPFIMYKFRTMAHGSDKLQKRLQKHNEADGPKAGKFLSHTGMDELPQLWNVLKGDMALIGPRPLPLEEACRLAKWQKRRHTIKPGIISPWVLNGYHSRPFSEWMKSDITYAKQKSLRYDAGVCFQMIPYLGKLFIQEIREDV